MNSVTDQLLRAILAGKKDGLSIASKAAIKTALNKVAESLLVNMLYHMMNTKLLWLVLDNRPSEDKVALIQFLIEAINEELRYRYHD